jgi:hypothetical protein
VETNTNDSDEPSLRLSRFAFRLRAAIKDEVVCFECGERKGPAGFASNQHKRAMFYAARDGKNRSLPVEKNEKTGTENDGSTPSNENENANVPERQTRESFWRERNAVARLCHWDERGIEANVSRKAECEGARSSRVRSDCGEKKQKPSQDEKLVEKKKDVKFVARCLACVAKDPEVSAYRRRAERNDADASRTTCVRCGVRFEKRNKLFEHLKASPCGVQDGEVIEGHVSTRG